MALRSRARPRGYEIKRRFAAGGMGEVYQGEAPDLHRQVAVKRMLETYADDQDLKLLFLREVMVAATLEHHNVVEVLDAGLAQSELFLVMEFVDGPSLAEIMEVLHREGEKLPIEVSLGIVSQVAQGLAHAHERALPDGTPLGIVHRDVAPENVLIGTNGIPKVVDFGLAKLNGQSLTQPGVIRGRPRSLAPEQARGDEVDVRTDIFALGTILFELISGQGVYPEENMATLLWRVAAGDYPPLAPRLPEVDPDLIAIIEKALAVDPADRYPSARNFERRLATFRATRDMSMSSRAVAQLVTRVWPKVEQLRKASMDDSEGELEGVTLTLPADRLEALTAQSNLSEAADALLEGTTEQTPEEKTPPPRKKFNHTRLPAPAALPSPQAPARQLTGDVFTEGNSSLIWAWYTGLMFAGAAIVFAMVWYYSQSLGG